MEEEIEAAEELAEWVVIQWSLDGYLIIINL